MNSDAPGWLKMSRRELTRRTQANCRLTVDTQSSRDCQVNRPPMEQYIASLPVLLRSEKDNTAGAQQAIFVAKEMTKTLTVMTGDSAACA